MKKIIFLLLLFVSCSLFATPKVSLQKYRWRSDNGSASTATWRAANNTPITITSKTEKIRLRVEIFHFDESGFNNSHNTPVTLFYTKNGVGGLQTITTTSSNLDFMITDAALEGNGNLVSQQLSANTIYQGGPFIDANYANVTIFAPRYMEMEYCIVPTANVSNSSQYTFSIAAVNNGYVNTPTLNTNFCALEPATAPANQSFCGNIRTINLSATGTNITWYDRPTGGTAIQPATFLTTGTYYAVQSFAGCESDTRTAVSVTVTITPDPPTAPSTQRFCNDAKISDLAATGSNLKWYISPISTIVLNPTTSLNLGTYNYYVTQTINGCESTRTLVTAVKDVTFWNQNWSDGEPISTTKGAIFNSDYTANRSLMACEVLVKSPAVVTFPGGTNLTAANKITVEPGATLIFENNSNLVQISNAPNSGNITYKRNASMKRLDYTYWSSPVAGQKLLTFTPNTLPNRFYTFNEPTNTFVQVANPAATNFDAAKGYSIRAPNNFLATPQIFNGVFTGVPNNGNFTVPLTFTANQGVGFNLIGNPYPSTIDATAFLTFNPGSVYFWTHQSSYNANNQLINAGFANYASMSLAGSVATRASASVSGGTNILPNGYIQAGQGFMFFNALSTNVFFSNTMRWANTEGQFFRTPQTIENNKFWLNLTNSDGAFSQTMIAYLPSTSTNFDNGYDAPQLNNNGLSSIIENQKYAIQSRGIFVNSDVVKLNLNIATEGSYTISKENTEGVFNTAQDFFLRDNLLGLTHNIKQSSYTFVSEAGNITNRFEIVYQSALSNNANVFNAANVIVFEQNAQLNISATDDLKSIKIFDIQGRTIFETKEINAKSMVLSTFRSLQQVLMIQITNLNNEVVTKKVIF